MLFLEKTSPPPFYQEQLSSKQRTELDKWFIGKRSQAYYLKRFAAFDEQGYLSPKWHWAAFFATFGWLLFRKRYIDCIVYTIAGWSFIQLNVAIILVAFEFLFMSFVPHPYQMITRIGIAGAIWIFWSVIVARWADAYYYRVARREIADVIEDYPNDPQRQKEKLEQEGGASMLGLGLAFGIFSMLVMILKVQFLPLYAKPKEYGIIQHSYEVTRYVSNRVEIAYQKQGVCPVNMPLNFEENELTLQISTSSQALPNNDTPCVVTGTIKNIPFPNRNLNNQTFIMYRESKDEESAWRCVSSFNDKLTPNACG